MELDAYWSPSAEQHRYTLARQSDELMKRSVDLLDEEAGASCCRRRGARGVDMLGEELGVNAELRGYPILQGLQYGI